MKSHLSEEQISDWIAGKSDAETERHILSCSACSGEIEKTRNALLLFRDSGYQCGEYWQAPRAASRTPHAFFRWSGVGIASAAIAILTASTLYRAQAPQNPPKQQVFMRIPYVVPPAPYERTEIVRMDVPVAALIAVGFNVNAAAGESISADVLVGQDSRPLAVRFPEDVE
jgi:hypothetical protein